MAIPHSEPMKLQPQELIHGRWCGIGSVFVTGCGEFSTIPSHSLLSAFFLTPFLRAEIKTVLSKFKVE